MKEPNSYAYVIEQADDRTYWAYVPDLPGCTTTAARVEDTEAQLREAVALYLSFYRDRNLPTPRPVARVGVLTAA